MLFILKKLFYLTILKFFLFVGRKVFFLCFILFFLTASIIYISYPYIKINVREKNTSKYLHAIEKIYKEKPTRENLLEEIKKQSSTNKISLLLKFLPELSIKEEEKIALLKKFASFTNSSPFVYNLLILKLTNYLIERGDDDALRYLKKIKKKQPLYETAKKQLIKYYIVKKDFTNAREQIKQAEKENLDVKELSEMLTFLQKVR